MGRLLDNYDRLQAQPVGSISARNSDPGLRQMNSQRSALTSALRRGIREAKRKGDFERVAKGIGMGNAYGVETTGIGSYEARMAGGEAFADKIRKESDMNAELANRAANGVTKIGAAPQQEIPERDTVNPEATPLKGSGTPVKNPGGPTLVGKIDPGFAAEGTVSARDVGSPASPAGGNVVAAGDKYAATVTQGPAPKPSLDDQARADTRAKTLGGAFGTGAQNKARREEADLLTDSVVSGETDFPTAVRKAVKLGGNAYSLADAVRRTRAGKFGIS